MKKTEWAGKALHMLDKYKYVLLVAVVGVILLLWPTGTKKTAAGQATLPQRDALELKLEDALARIQGVGEVTVVLTDRDPPPGYQGALVVADGGDSPQIRLELCRIVSALTGLGADKITISKGK